MFSTRKAKGFGSGLPKKKRIESVKRHRQWQAQLQREKFFDRIFGTRSRGPVKK